MAISGEPGLVLFSWSTYPSKRVPNTEQPRIIMLTTLTSMKQTSTDTINGMSLAEKLTTHLPAELVAFPSEPFHQPGVERA